MSRICKIAKGITVDRFIEACKRLESKMSESNDGCDYALKAYLAVNLFMWHLKVFPTDQEPVEPMVKKVEQAVQMLDFARECKMSPGFYPKTQWRMALDDKTDKEPFEEELSSLFASVWDDMTDNIYFDESIESISKRFEVNDIDAKDLFKDKTVLDAGCGSGKFACAIAKLGAGKVTGADLSERAIAFAASQAKKAGLDHKMEFIQGSVCDLKKYLPHNPTKLYSKLLPGHWHAYRKDLLGY